MYPLSNNSSFSPLLFSDSHHTFPLFMNFNTKWNHSIFPFVTGLFHKALCPEISSTLHICLSLLRLNNTPLYKYISFYITLLYCTSLTLIFFFLNSKFCGNTTWSNTTGTIFQTEFAYFMFLCHSLVFLSIFQMFSLLSNLLWWPVILRLLSQRDCNSLKTQVMVSNF